MGSGNFQSKCHSGRQTTTTRRAKAGIHSIRSGCPLFQRMPSARGHDNSFFILNTQGSPLPNRGSHSLDVDNLISCRYSLKYLTKCIDTVSDMFPKLSNRAIFTKILRALPHIPLKSKKSGTRVLVPLFLLLLKNSGVTGLSFVRAEHHEPPAAIPLRNSAQTRYIEQSVYRRELPSTPLKNEHVLQRSFYRYRARR